MESHIESIAQVAVKAAIDRLDDRMKKCFNAYYRGKTETYILEQTIQSAKDAYNSVYESERLMRKRYGDHFIPTDDTVLKKEADKAAEHGIAHCVDHYIVNIANLFTKADEEDRYWASEEGLKVRQWTRARMSAVRAVLGEVLNSDERIAEFLLYYHNHTRAYCRGQLIEGLWERLEVVYGENYEELLQASPEFVSHSKSLPEGFDKENNPYRIHTNAHQILGITIDATGVPKLVDEWVKTIGE